VINFITLLPAEPVSNNTVYSSLGARHVWLN